MPATTEPLTLEEFIGSFDLSRQKYLRENLQKHMELLFKVPPEVRGDLSLVLFLTLKRCIEPALTDKPFEPEDAQ